VIHLLLKDHPHIAALNDELKVFPFFSTGLSTFTFGNDLEEERQAGFPALFDAFSTIQADRNTLANGAKCVCNSPRSARVVVDAVQRYMKDLKIILIVRNDLVAQYGSLITARKTGIYHSWYKDFDKSKVHPIRIQKWPFIGYAINCLEVLKTLRELHKTHEVVECHYEDFLARPESVHEQLFHFLNVPDLDVTWLRSKKVMPGPEHYIRNYHRMKGILEELNTRHMNGGISRLNVLFARLHYRLFDMRTSIPKSMGKLLGSYYLFKNRLPQKT